MAACFIVGAEVVDTAVKDDFDRRYQDDHLPEALAGPVAEFGRLRGDRVVRGREIVDVKQIIEG